MKNLLPKTASQRAIAGLTSLALVAGGLTVMPYAGAQDEPNANAPIVADVDNGAPAEEIPQEEITAARANELNAALPTGKATGIIMGGTAVGSEVEFHAIGLKPGDKIISVGQY